LDDRVLTARAVPLLALAVAALARPDVRAPVKRREVATRRIAEEHDVAAAPAVTPVGPTARHVRLAAEAHATIPPATCLDVNPCAVLEQR
jgi:hypothetical protein